MNIESFGINTNLLDTNVVNLAVVVGCLVYYGGEILNGFLESRQEKILKNFKDAEEAYLKTERDLEEAKSAFTDARDKYLDMEERNSKEALQEVVLDTSDLENRSRNLYAIHKVNLRRQEEKVVQDLYRKTTSMAINLATSKLKERLVSDPKIHRKLIAMNISVITSMCAKKA
jgi:F-type H+-transporting ATPase subunit b